MPDFRHKKDERTPKVRPVFLRRLIWLGVIGVALYFAYDKLGNKILLPLARQQIENLTGTEVNIDSLQFEANGSVSINSLSIGPQDEDIYDSVILKARQVDVSFSFLSLLKFQPAVKRIAIGDFLANVIYDADEKQWNIADLKFADASGKAPLPVISAKSGIIKLSRIEKSTTKVLSVVGVNGVFAPARGLSQTYSFFVDVDERLGFRGSKLNGKWKTGADGKLELVGQILMNGSPVYENTWDMRKLVLNLDYDENNITVNKLKWDMAEQTTVTLSAKIDNYRSDPQYSLDVLLENAYFTDTATADSIVYGEQLLEKCALPLKTFLKEYDPKGFADLEIHTAGNFADPNDNMYSGKITCRDMSALYTGFPYRLEHIAGTVEFAGEGVVLDQLNCKHGDVDINIDGYSKGTGAALECDIEITSPNMLIDDDLYKALGPKQKDLWWTFTPSGLAKANYTIRKQPGEKEQPNLTIELLNVQAAYKHFPYPLRNLKGTVSVEPGKLVIDKIVSRRNGSEIALTGSITDAESPRPRYNIVITATDIPIDDTLKAALPLNQRRFYEHFDVDALTDVEVTVFPNEVGRRLVEYIAKVNIKDASLIYDEFPLPLTKLNVEAVLTADKIMLKSMDGMCGTGRITIDNGIMWPATDANPDPGFCLTLNARNLDLKKEFLSALPEEPAAIVSLLQPKGKVNVSADINLNSRRDDCQPYKIVIDCLQNDFTFKKFPYPLKNVTGTVTVTDKNIDLKNITAIPAGDTPDDKDDQPKIIFNANLAYNESFVEKGNFTISAANIKLDDRLGKAFSETGNDLLLNLSPAGIMDVEIDDARFYTDIDDKMKVELTTHVALRDGSLGSNGTLTDIEAVLDASTVYELGTGFVSTQAQFRSDRLNLRKKTIENLQADISYDPVMSVFSTRRLTADFYDGKFFGDVELKYPNANGAQYLSEIVFNDVNVKKLLAKTTDTDEKNENITKGRACGSLSVAGVFDGSNRTMGRLNIAVSEMELARRSFLGKIITTLQMNEPTDFMFSDMTVDSYLRNNDLVFENVYMSGKSLVLKGEGKLDLKANNVDLDFAAFSGQKHIEPDLLGSLARGLGKAVITVEVHGNIEDPKITTTPLPVFKTPLDLLGDKL